MVMSTDYNTGSATAFVASLVFGPYSDMK